MEIFFILVFLVVLIGAASFRKQRKPKSRFQSKTEWGTIEAVPEEFDWATETPHKYRPFKSIYHLTMSVTRTNRQEWLKMDDSYMQAIKNHKKTMAAHPDLTNMLRKSPTTNAAIHEIYDLVIDTLIQRFPKYFVGQGKVMENKITGSKIPRFASKDIDPRDCLRNLALTVEEDIFVLQYDPEVEEYRLEATTGLAGLGFEWRSKVGLKLTDIHAPVPQYRERLQMSMNRYFHKIVPGNFTQRVTYGVMLGDKHDLFSNGNLSGADELDVNDLDFANKVFVRLERQVLFRLPVSNFLGFSIRTYMYSLAELKTEGLGDACANALEAWPDDTAKYKGRHVWGPPVLEYLRS